MAAAAGREETDTEDVSDVLLDDGAIDDASNGSGEGGSEDSGEESGSDGDDSSRGRNRVGGGGGPGGGPGGVAAAPGGADGEGGEGRGEPHRRCVGCAPSQGPRGRAGRRAGLARGRARALVSAPGRTRARVSKVARPVPPGRLAGSPDGPEEVCGGTPTLPPPYRPPRREETGARMTGWGASVARGVLVLTFAPAFRAQRGPDASCGGCVASAKAPREGGVRPPRGEESWRPRRPSTPREGRFVPYLTGDGRIVFVHAAVRVLALILR